MQEPTLSPQLHPVHWPYAYHIQMRVCKSSQWTSCLGISFYTHEWYTQERFEGSVYGFTLGASIRRMSHLKVVPDGLKPQECKRNTGQSKPPIPSIPEKDVIQEAVDSSANSLKLTLPHKVEFHVRVWSKGTPEQFLVHIQQAPNAIRQKGLLMAYEKAIKDQEQCIEN